MFIIITSMNHLLALTCSNVPGMSAASPPASLLTMVFPALSPPAPTSQNFKVLPPSIIGI